MGLTRNQIANATAAFHASRSEALGIPLIFRGREITGIVTADVSPISLGDGGFSESTTFSIMISSIDPAPRLRETITDPAGARRFSITAVHTPSPGSALAGFHRLSASLT